MSEKCDYRRRFLDIMLLAVVVAAHFVEHCIELFGNLHNYVIHQTAEYQITESVEKSFLLARQCESFHLPQPLTSRMSVKLKRLRRLGRGSSLAKNFQKNI